MSETHTHTCPECSRVDRCELACAIVLWPELTLAEIITAELPIASAALCARCDVSHRYGAPFQEGARLIAADTAYVYEVLSISPSALQPFGRPGWLAAELRSVEGYPDDTRTVQLDRDRRPLDYGDEHTSWEHVKKS